MSTKSRRMIELPIVCNCDCWAVHRPWLVQIKRLSTSDRSDATRPTTKPTMPFEFGNIGGRQHRMRAEPCQRADKGRHRHNRGAIDENHGALPYHRATEDARGFTILVSAVMLRSPATSTQATRTRNPIGFRRRLSKGRPPKNCSSAPVVEVEQGLLRVELAENQLELRCVVMTALL